MLGIFEVSESVKIEGHLIVDIKRALDRVSQSFFNVVLEVNCSTGLWLHRKKKEVLHRKLGRTTTFLKQ